MAAKRRPSFSPESTKAAAASTHTDWVYRTDSPAPSRVAPRPPSPRSGGASQARPRPAGPPSPRSGVAGRGRPGIDKTAGLLTPLALVHLIVLAPLVSCVRRLLTRS